MPSVTEGRLRRRLERQYRPSWRKASLSLVTTLVPLVICCACAHRTLDASWPLALVCRVLAAGFLVRAYIVQHDCSHGSFFPNARANHALGCALGALTLIPYFRWRHDHARHHATSGNLGRRGRGDIWTLTLREYERAPVGKRVLYRLFRHPLVLFGLVPIVLFVVLQRLTRRTKTSREVRSVHATSVAAALVLAVSVYALGWRQVLAVEGVSTWLAATVAVWLFYIQHQFPEAYWEVPARWDIEASALRGASHYRLPPVLRFFTGSIGLHHVHHLASRIPSYELQACLDAHTDLQSPPLLTFWRSLRCASLRVWDEDRNRMLSWGEVGEGRGHLLGRDVARAPGPG